MEQEYLSNEIYEKIKNFVHYKLTKKQKLLIDKLILNDELKKRYKKYGLCEECNQPNTCKAFEPWCQSCNAKHFQQNFKNWTSGNHVVDEFIRNSQLTAKSSWEALEWFEYKRFENVEYIARGGFGTIYKANWKYGVIGHWDNFIDQWVRNEDVMVALKCLNNSKDISFGFLNEINLHLKMNSSSCVVRCYGITKEPATGNFMMVMQYAEKGNLRQRLNKHFNKMNWENKFKIMRDIAIGLIEIHKEGLIHQDFHSGNILSFTENSFSITDLGLCKPASEKSEYDNNQVYGVLPYVAPEILIGKEYTQASDIYSYGIIAYEVCTGFPPYHEVAHDEFLATKICLGLRPRPNYKIPQLVLNLIKKCCDAEPLNRPKASYLNNEFAKWHLDLNSENFEDTEIYKQIVEAKKLNKGHNITFKINDEELEFITHPQAIYTSKLLNFNLLPEPKNSDDDENIIYSKSTEIDFTKPLCNE